MPRQTTARKIISDLRAYDRDQKKATSKLERVLERTLADIRALNGNAPVRRRRRARSEA